MARVNSPHLSLPFFAPVCLACISFLCSVTSFFQMLILALGRLPALLDTAGQGDYVFGTGDDSDQYGISSNFGDDAENRDLGHGELYVSFSCVSTDCIRFFLRKTQGHSLLLSFALSC